MTLRGFAVTLAALTTLVGLAAPASAEVQVREDPRGDVRLLDARGARSSADIVRLTGTHEGSALRFDLDLADLRGSADAGGVYAGIRMRTPTGADFDAIAYRTRSRTSVDLVRAGRDQRVRCRGLDVRFLPEADRVALVVPRSCVQRPRWVRFGAVTAAGSRTYYGDDARRDGKVDVDDGVPRLGTRRLHRS